MRVSLALKPIQQPLACEIIVQVGCLVLGQCEIAVRFS